ncbi:MULTISPECIES: diguanylate cyclase [unclassified Agarivorans]|uniref:GGDEF domain-containing protein n=1 Tax=unclassified Agarivorans TaxID=2636026 RepID=UPI003D7EE1F5
MDDQHSLSRNYYQILDALPDHVFIFSESGVYLDVFGGEDNDAGFDCKPFIGKSLYDVTSQDIAEEFHGYIKKTLATNKTLVVHYHFANENMLALPDGISVPNELWFEGIIKPLPLLEDGQKRVVWTARNITLRHNLEEQLKKLSETDELTGILNRRAFMAKLTIELHRYQRYKQNTSLLMLDIDRFKSINDLLGHQSGDRVIKHVTDICSKEIREVDYIGRLGGEEFAILLSNANLLQAIEMAERLRQKIARSPCVVEDYTIHITVSIGLSQIETEADSSEYLISRADKAMYHAKKQGRDQVRIFHDELCNHEIELTQHSHIRKNKA